MHVCVCELNHSLNKSVETFLRTTYYICSKVYCCFTRMDLEIVRLSEVSQRRRNIVWHPLCAGSKKKWHKRTYLQNRSRFTDLENELMVAKGDGSGEGIVRESGMVMYTSLYLKWITNKEILYSPGNSTQSDVAAWMQGRFGENRYM